MGNCQPQTLSKQGTPKCLHDYFFLPKHTFTRAQPALNTLLSKLEVRHSALLSKNLSSVLRLLNFSHFEVKMHSESMERDWNTTGTLSATLCHSSTVECQSLQHDRTSENLTLVYHWVSLCVPDHRKEWKGFDGSFPTIQYWFGCAKHNLALILKAFQKIERCLYRTIASFFDLVLPYPDISLLVL